MGSLGGSDDAMVTRVRWCAWRLIIDALGLHTPIWMRRELLPFGLAAGLYILITAI